MVFIRLVAFIQHHLSFSSVLLWIFSHTMVFIKLVAFIQHHLSFSSVLLGIFSQSMVFIRLVAFIQHHLAFSSVLLGIFSQSMVFMKLVAFIYHHFRGDFNTWLKLRACSNFVTESQYINFMFPLKTLFRTLISIQKQIFIKL